LADTLKKVIDILHKMFWIIQNAKDLIKLLYNLQKGMLSYYYDEKTIKKVEIFCHWSTSTNLWLLHL